MAVFLQGSLATCSNFNPGFFFTLFLTTDFNLLNDTPARCLASAVTGSLKRFRPDYCQSLRSSLLHSSISTDLVFAFTRVLNINARLLTIFILPTFTRTLVLSIWNWESGVGHRGISIWHWASGVGHLALDIWHLESSIERLP